MRTRPEVASDAIGICSSRCEMRTRAIFLASVLAVVFPLAGNAQCRDGVVGTWKLVSVTAKTDKGDADKAVLEQNPSGLLTCTADGRMMAILYC